MTNSTDLKALTSLRSAKLTSDMETEHLRTLADLATELEFTEDEIIYQKGSAGKAIYLIEAGEVVIETGSPGNDHVIINTLGPKQFFGWSSLFPEERKMAQTRATKPTQTIAFEAGQIRRAWQTDHKLEFALVRRAGRDLANRIKATRRQLDKMINQN